MILSLVTDLIGKDLSRFTFPVFINEPCNILMKPAELLMIYNTFLDEAS
jgi:hypothetical protein